MLVGNKERFAIEASVEQSSNGWIWGHFRFWLRGRPVGDWEDIADLNGCVRWLLDFANNPRDRYDPQLVNLDPVSVFSLIYDPVVGSDGIADPNKQPIPYSFSRFHVSHLGMSSFERFDLLLLKDEHGAERCLWREAGSIEINDCWLEKDEMELISSAFCRRFKEQLGNE